MGSRGQDYEAPPREDWIRTRNGGPKASCSLPSRAAQQEHLQAARGDYSCFPASFSGLLKARRNFAAQPTSRPTGGGPRANLRSVAVAKRAARFTSLAQLRLDFSHRTTALAATSSRKSSSKTAAIPTAYRGAASAAFGQGAQPASRQPQSRPDNQLARESEEGEKGRVLASFLTPGYSSAREERAGEETDGTPDAWVERAPLPPLPSGKAGSKLSGEQKERALLELKGTMGRGQNLRLRKRGGE